MPQNQEMAGDKITAYGSASNTGLMVRAGTQIRPYGAGFDQYDDFFKAAKVHHPEPKSRFIF
jgi:hypothetical protein